MTASKTHPKSKSVTAKYKKTTYVVFLYIAVTLLFFGGILAFLKNPEITDPRVFPGILAIWKNPEITESVGSESVISGFSVLKKRDSLFKKPRDY